MLELLGLPVSYGLLYNWCAAIAMGNQAAACQTDTATPADPSINICPAGWRLPTGEATTGEFTLLNNAIGGSGAAGTTNLLNNSLFMCSGNFSTGAFSSQGTAGLGFYWSSTVFSATNSHNLSFNAGGVNPANSSSKGHGLAVRCVAEMSI